MDLLLASEPLRSSMPWTEGGSEMTVAVGDGKCLAMERIPSSSSSEMSEVSLRSLGVGIRREEARLGLLLFQLERTLVDERGEVAVAAETRLDLREDHSPFLMEGLHGLRGEVRGLGGRGTLGGGPRGFEQVEEDAALEATSLLLATRERGREAVLARALELRREGGPEDDSVAVVVWRL